MEKRWPANCSCKVIEQLVSDRWFQTASALTDVRSPGSGHRCLDPGRMSAAREAIDHLDSVFSRGTLLRSARRASSRLGAATRYMIVIMGMRNTSIGGKRKGKVEPIDCPAGGDCL
jgi:hypothetical protein